MESISDTIWDVVICGTGLQQSLLALSLSRSDKKILHIDPNPYYGSAEAALSLAEVDEWAAARPGASSTRLATSTSRPALARLSAYSVALAPQFLHARSALVNLLVSSRAFRQLEFLAVSSFFVLESLSFSPSSPIPFSIVRIPATREDVFASTAMPARSKRHLMKFLKFVLSYDGGDGDDGKDEKNGDDGDSKITSWKAHAQEPFGSFLQSAFSLDDRMRDNVLALTLSLDGASITVAEGLSRLHRHITSMGVFGAGFAAVYPKWGGCGEIVQVSCRAAAVGGGIYMLGSGVRSVKYGTENAAARDSGSAVEPLVEVELTQDMTVKTKLLVKGSEDDKGAETHPPQQHLSRLVAIVGSPLGFLFAPTVEGAPVAGGAVIALPAGRPVSVDGTVPEHPIFVMAHSSDTGECPPGQSLLYFTTIQTLDSKSILEKVLDSLLAVLGREAGDGGSGTGSATGAPPISCLYKLYYEQPRGGSSTNTSSVETLTSVTSPSDSTSAVYQFPPLPVDLTMQDGPLDVVRSAWKRVMGPEADDGAYMVFDDREEGVTDDEYD